MAVKDLFEDRSHEEIEELFDTWMKRDFEDIPLDTFFAVLEEIGARRPTQYLEMEGEIVGDTLVFIPPKDTPLPFTVHDDEIFLGDYTIRVRLKGVRPVVSTEASVSANVERG